MNAKKLLLVLLATGSTAIGFSQVRFGAKAGLNLATLNGTYPPTVDHKSQIGFHAGGTAEKTFGASGVTLVAEALISTEGGVTEQYSYDLTEKSSQTLKTTYINIPLYVKYEVFNKFSVEAGPQIGFAISAKNQLEYSDSTDPTQNTKITIDQMSSGTYVSEGGIYQYRGIRKVDMGMLLGMTYDLNEALYVQLHYNYGITPVDVRSSSALVAGFGQSSWKVKNAVFQFSVGYKFN